MRKTKKELKRYVGELCELTCSPFPGAQVRVKPPYETDGGTAKREKLLREGAWDILLEKGYDILVFVEKPNRRKADGNSKKQAKTSVTG